MPVRDMENSHGRGAKGRRGDAVFGIGASFSQSSSLDKSPSRPNTWSCCRYEEGSSRLGPSVR